MPGAWVAIYQFLLARSFDVIGHYAVALLRHCAIRQCQIELEKEIKDIDADVQRIKRQIAAKQKGSLSSGSKIHFCEGKRIRTIIKIWGYLGENPRYPRYLAKEEEKTVYFNRQNRRIYMSNPTALFWSYFV